MILRTPIARVNRIFLFASLLLSLLSSCKVYKQDLLLKVGENTTLQERVEQAESNYKIRKDDWLKINVFANQGEQLIDQNFQFPGEGQNNMNNQQFFRVREAQQYLVQSDGTVKFPVVGSIYLEGLTLDEAEAKLEVLYSDYFKESFVRLQFLNKRVVVLSGQQNMVVPLENQNMNLLEVIALSGGVNFGSRANNIRLIRGDLTNPDVYMIDLTTIEGMQQSIVDVQPGDIIYIEPWRRPWRESLRDISPILGVVSSVTTLVFLLANANF